MPVNLTCISIFAFLMDRIFQVGKIPQLTGNVIPDRHSVAQVCHIFYFSSHLLVKFIIISKTPRQIKYLKKWS